jgi:anti-sigma factor RsiW
MDHADVRAWLADAFFRPGLLRALDDDHPDAASDDPQVAGLRQHLATCDQCGAELVALRSTAVALDLALGPPAGARERVLARVSELGRERKAAPRRRWWRPTLSLPRAAAALAVFAAIVFGLGAAAGLILSSAGDQPSRLAAVLAQMDERLAEPGVLQATLRDGSGSGAGLVVLSPDSQRLAVFTASLEPPSTGRYECYLERNGERTLIGPMIFEGPVAFWAGPVDTPADAGRPGDRFLVLLGAADGEPRLQTEF